MSKSTVNADAGTASASSACSAVEKYRNPDPRCTYPWSPGGAGYCWSFAHHVDGTKGYEDMEKICRGCAEWKPNTELNRSGGTTVPR